MVASVNPEDGLHTGDDELLDAIGSSLAQLEGVLEELGPLDPDNELQLSLTAALDDLRRASDLRVAGLVVREVSAEQAPIPMVLRCPCCGVQHIDAPEPSKGWLNPPHRSHLCVLCGTVWRPADVPTTGVAAVSTRGQADTYPPEA